ncbi:MaoC family dehydratase [Aquabacterium sp. J223]|uniref:MaoC family dehydratase n=1 Tax=Aquabacterium sp. J223 TaxID=2898431 RepID=UPI0021ADA2CB|nr:MaoC family dehydratase [Aquabacterium sp. J223]UUX96693.1 MaoC family dehydratase [Aquabacterium sp. J223]
MDTAPRYFEDFQVGEHWESAPVQVTADEIVAFGRSFDPQPMHVDEAAAARGPFKGLIASGWHVAAIAMREFVRAGGHGSTPAVGLGVDELKWQAPVRADDRLVVRREVVELRRSASQPGQGIVRTRVTVRNQAGVVVMSLLSAGRVAARGTGSAA